MPAPTGSTLIAPPFAVIDFEASSLSLSTLPEISSYPIEVGIAIADERGIVSSWSTLIRPDPSWVRHGEWDRRSERVYGITRDDLASGATPAAVAAELNARLASIGIVWCDGGRYDAHWLAVLYATAQIELAFTLVDVAAIWVGNRAAKERYDAVLGQGARRHRAEADAVEICQALLIANAAIG